MSGGLLRPALTAVLGPTNTGKTHLAVDRMCGHASGMIGFPLRLLAREVYDRVVRLKGAAQVALITGEEKILPEGARYFLCTAESMPSDREVAFVALDEAQTGMDLERGHVFTDRMLHMRGYAETMILGSESLRPLIRRLLPDAEIITRPRFSTLAYAEPRKLSRLPKRSAIVAFTTQEVYGLAEMLRRHKGGAAVVMGGLSPRTRNAQVELYQSGEVDYLVATDAIGMGLNMDIAHVAFAALSKFDGRRSRRLTSAEMAQIAGRAGRYQRDGSFGTVQLGREAAEGFEMEEVNAIENHRFPALSRLVWRNARLEYHSLSRLIKSLDMPSPRPELMRADDAIDVSVLKKLADESWVEDRARTPAMLQRLWNVCGLPDYRKTGAEQHARLVGTMYRHLTEGDYRLPEDWIARELAILDNVQGDMDMIADRIAAARTWTYVAHRPQWLADSTHWAERTRALEDKLSDALHLRLTQRFVDRRTSVLMRDLGARGSDLLVEVDEAGQVSVEGEAIGTLSAFRFQPDPHARAGEKRRLLAAAEKHLVREFSARAALLARDEAAQFSIGFDGEMPPRLLWRGANVAVLLPGRDALHPRIELDRTLSALSHEERAAVQARLVDWVATYTRKCLGPLVRLSERTAPDAGLSAMARGLIVQMVEHLGCLARAPLAPQVAALSKNDRTEFAKAGVQIGSVHIYLKALLRPEATRLRLALWAVHRRLPSVPDLPPAGRVSLAFMPQVPHGWYQVAGYWPVGEEVVRVDMVERLAQVLHNNRHGRTPFSADTTWAATMGLTTASFARLMRQLGYKPRSVDGKPAFQWQGRKPSVERGPGADVQHSPFAILEHMRRR